MLLQGGRAAGNLCDSGHDIRVVEARQQLSILHQRCHALARGLHRACMAQEKRCLRASMTLLQLLHGVASVCRPFRALRRCSSGLTGILRHSGTAEPLQALLLVCLTICRGLKCPPGAACARHAAFLHGPCRPATHACCNTSLRQVVKHLGRGMPALHRRTIEKALAQCRSGLDCCECCKWDIVATGAR